MMNKTTSAVVIKTNEPVKREIQSGKLRIGKTTYTVNVHFGKTPLEDILKNRILNGLKRA